MLAERDENIPGKLEGADTVPSSDDVVKTGAGIQPGKASYASRGSSTSIAVSIAAVTAQGGQPPNEVTNLSSNSITSSSSRVTQAVSSSTTTNTSSSSSSSTTTTTISSSSVLTLASVLGQEEPSSTSSSSSTVTTSSAEPSNELGDISSSAVGHHGLSTGAIAGIVVGCVIGGLLIIGAVIFLVLRRRQRRADIQQGAYSVTAADSVFFDKQTHTRNVKTEMLNGAYHHQQQQQQQQQHHKQQIPLNEDYHNNSNLDDGYYQDTPLTERTLHDSTGAGQERGHVAHLVEEGMTDEDIRRLEREERELDEEIERAGR